MTEVGLNNVTLFSRRSSRNGIGWSCSSDNSHYWGADHHRREE